MGKIAVEEIIAFLAAVYIVYGTYQNIRCNTELKELRAKCLDENFGSWIVNQNGNSRFKLFTRLQVADDLQLENESDESQAAESINSD